MLTEATKSELIIKEFSVNRNDFTVIEKNNARVKVRIMTPLKGTAMQLSKYWQHVANRE